MMRDMIKMIGTIKMINNRGANLLRYALLLLMMILGGEINSAWGQDYSGTYYIASGGLGEKNGENTTYTYNPNSPEANFYLCPTEEWCYYQDPDKYWPSNTADGNKTMPFLTTYKCRSADYHSGNASDAVWEIKKAPNSSYYYIIQKSTGKYMVSNGQIETTTNPDRIRVHLQSFSSNELEAQGDNVLFDIVKSNLSSTYTYIEISPKGIKDNTNPHSGHTNHKWLTVNFGNYNSLVGKSGKNGGPDGYEDVSGIVCIYSAGDANAPFCLEDYITRPTITYNDASDEITITASQSGATLIYTTDGSTPTTSNGTPVNNTTVTFNPSDGATTIRAVAVVGGELSNVATFTTPVFFGSQHKYLIQSQNNGWTVGDSPTDFHFYMIPGDDEGEDPNKITKVNTTSLFRSTMEWYFLNGGVDSDVQYYYIVNNITSKYLCYDTTNGVYMDDFDSGDDKFRFKIVESGNAGSFNIIPYELRTASGSINRFVCKPNDGNNVCNANANAIILNNASNAHSQWKFIVSSTLDKTAPFSVSVPASNNYSYYKIGNVGNSGYYIVPGATNATTSNSTSDNMNWYFEVAQAADASDWLTYYHIRNAVTGDYLYFTKDDNDAGACLETRSTITDGNEDRYMFTWAKTANANVNYYIIPQKLKDKSKNQFSTLRRDNGTLKTNLTRGAGTYAWTFESSTYTCAQPVISWSDVDGGYVITATESDAKIYYKIGEGELTPTTGTLYTGAVPVAELGVKSATIRAIAARNSDGSDASSEESVIVNRVATPAISQTEDGKVEINCDTDGTNIYYEMGVTPSDPTTSSTLYGSSIDGAAGKVIKAIAVKGGWINSAVATSGTITFACAKPVIRKTSATTFTIECGFPASGVTIYYEMGSDPSDPTSSSSSTSSGSTITATFPITIKAIAIATGYDNSVITTKYIARDLDKDPDDNYYVIASAANFNQFVDMVNAGDADKNYKITADISVSNPDIIEESFTGELKGVAKADGSLPVINGMTHSIFNTINGGVVKSIILDNVSISGSGTSNRGAIANEATGDSRIYNCGVLATGSTVEKDEDGYDHITSCSSTISGGNYVGGLVGLLDGSSRVINCFSYANITGGSYRGGIVGWNNVSTTSANLKTMVMNCMFYGNINGGSRAPIYNGEIITNDGDGNGVNNFNYFWSGASYVQTRNIDVYNCALGAETRFLQRFEFFRPLLNSNRELAAWWASTSTTTVTKNEMMKWVMEPSQIGTTTPYPILKTPGKYASVVNYTPSETAYVEEHRNEGRNLSSEGEDGVLHVTIKMDSNTGNTPYSQPIGASLKNGETGKFDLIITDKDFEHFNFNYGKVQLPYYNDYCDGNYTKNRVVTGWKIVSITGGTSTGYSTGEDVTYENGELTATPYNFADRNCTNKDLYGTNGSYRVFNQGAYWDVPKGVQSITIEPYWAKCAYLADAAYDVVYQTSGTDDMVNASNVPNVGGASLHYTSNGVSTNINGDNQLVYTTIGTARSNIGTTGTVYDNAIVLVGNYHYNVGGTNQTIGSNPYTIMAIDLDKDNEPDANLIMRFNGRAKFHAARYDFINLIGLGMAQKTTGGIGSYNFGIIQPLNWFEVTNTALFRATQFEYSPGSRTKKPIILQGGVIEQWVTQQDDAGDKVDYFHVGGNVWFKEFHRGSHQDNKNKYTPHPPVSVTGGDYDEFYLTGLYQSQATTYDDNAECYINGGRFGMVAGAGMEGIGTTEGKGNITWIIDNADIKEFYGGGINYDNPVFGNIHTIISNSHVETFCGGPKFGDMEEERTVITTANNCTFDTFFGAGYGGNSYNRYAPTNRNNVINLPGPGKVNNQSKDLNSWNGWVTDEYTQSYSGTYKGVSTQIDYQFIPMSTNVDNVARLFVEFVGFSLATTHNVTSTLTGCTIKSNFYGGGSLGKVTGPATSTLENCTVEGNVYGAGYSASRPKVEVMPTSGFIEEPYYDSDLGAFFDGELPSKETSPQTVTYSWDHRDLVNSTATAIDKTNHILYTQENLTTLGQVTGKVTLNITGNTLVKGNIFQTDANGRIIKDEFGNYSVKEQSGGVFGGGDASKALGDTEVNIQTTSRKTGFDYNVYNVFGGGNNAAVGGNTVVNLKAGIIQNHVFGGGNNGKVEGSTTVNVEESE